MKQTSNNKTNNSNQPGDKEAPLLNNTLFKKLKQNKKFIMDRLGNSEDIIVREFKIGPNPKTSVAVFYTDGLTDTVSVQKFIMESLLFEYKEEDIHEEAPPLLEQLKNLVLTVGELKEISDPEDLLVSLLSGNVILLLDGHTVGFDIGLKEWDNRGVTETSSESVVRGPKESFSEDIRTNTALIRRRIKDPDLWMETREIGRVTKTSVALMYIDGIVDETLVKEVRSRLDKIDIDGILESSYIEELIQDEALTPFPTLYNTERPDVVAAGLLEGRIAILVDGTPFTLLAPALFVQMFQAAEDYYGRSGISSALRLLRYFCFMIAFLAPSFYLAITTFHQEMIPTELLFSLVAQRERIPFPAVFEVLLMEFAFEILREASLRMPKAIGSAISIVGTLVIGQAAVEAGLVSASLIIVVSTTAIASFVFPANDLSIATRLLRFPLIILAANFGLVGILFGIITLIIHLCSLRSFGVPYMSSMAPYIEENQKDTFIRLPYWFMRTRPKLIGRKNLIRSQTPKPRPPK